ncbi:hypothetical protein [Actinomadura rupiterrae]|uniref:hypothetical protein n=1 Tax=Actinomadura rupiterrae TaxID=559627 RepID=UPI0020A4A3B4|nr:hypothetical protein [Actinomadura rupiterrae]MCP2337600.1 hypothetical protein [Actinomadura rupiterrae]
MIARRQVLKYGAAAAAVAASGAVLPGRALAAAPAAPAGDAVTVLLGNVWRDGFQGLGVHFSPFELALTDAQWRRVDERLAFMRPSLLRVMITPAWYVTGLDAPSGRPVYDWDSDQMRQLYGMLDRAERLGASVVIGDWVPGIGKFDVPGDDPRYATAVADLVEHLLDVRKYTCLALYNFHNEPNLWFPDYGDFDPWKRTLENVQGELSRRGLLDRISVVGPDATEADDFLSKTADTATGHDESWVVKTVDTSRGRVGAYDVHKYEYEYNVEYGDLENRLWWQRQYIDNGDTAAKPFLVTEAGIDKGLVSPDTQKLRYDFKYGVQMADYAVQVMRAGAQGVLAWDLDDAQHTGGEYGSKNLKGWGFWNSLGGQDGYPASDADLRPWYYTWSLLSRCFPKGSRILAVPGTGITGVRATAALLPGGDLSIAVVNDTDQAHTVRLNVPGVTSSLLEYRYFADDRPADAQGFPTPKRQASGPSFTADLPGRGVVIWTTLGLRPLPDVPKTTTFSDDLNDLSHVHAHSSGLALDKDNSAMFSGDPSRLKRTGWAPGWVVYKRPGLTSFVLTSYASGLMGKVTAQVSPDGTTWTDIALASSPEYKVDAKLGWKCHLLTPAAPLPANAAYLKIQLADDPLVFTPQLSRVQLTSRA